MSRRDVGAGIAGGGAALLATVLVNLWAFIESFGTRGLNAANIAAYQQESEVVFTTIFVVPVIAVPVSTVVWRLLMPDEPAPLRGALAGIGSAFGSLFGFGALLGFSNALHRLSAGGLGAAVSEFVLGFVTIALWGSFVTAPFIAPPGALGGYGYERYLTRG